MKKWLKDLGLGAAALVVAGAALASPQLAADYGCVNCHGAYQRGDAPTFERLSGKLAKYRGDEAAQARFVDKYRSGAPLEHVDAHERISRETATALVHWLVEGGQ